MRIADFLCSLTHRYTCCSINNIPHSVVLCYVWKVKGMQVGLAVNLRNQEGTLKLVLLDYGCYVGDLSIKLEGGASWLYQV